jgi:hypothetical protein
MGEWEDGGMGRRECGRTNLQSSGIAAFLHAGRVAAVVLALLRLGFAHVFGGYVEGIVGHLVVWFCPFISWLFLGIILFKYVGVRYRGRSWRFDIRVCRENVYHASSRRQFKFLRFSSPKGRNGVGRSKKDFPFVIACIICRELSFGSIGRGNSEMFPVNQ